jgi:hypothetical protein
MATFVKICLHVLALVNIDCNNRHYMKTYTCLRVNLGRNTLVIYRSDIYLEQKL